MTAAPAVGSRIPARCCAWWRPTTRCGRRSGWRPRRWRRPGPGTGLFTASVGPLVLGRGPATHLSRAQAAVALAQSLPLPAATGLLGGLAGRAGAPAALAACAAVLAVAAGAAPASPALRAVR
ncbi:hypothetical protein SAMN05660464_2493 [Geodermatophilus dictyosporus]|uniref:Uncharacterized protein n=1 Tax=Geodermatophilus dictyosporus TaxID=1523247 RepID=A0A1I5NFZ3_9ACTN|nr:hypothetical protein [Geodermatophilus dictyosporus]SFP20728.1 hypothetical protein SAMN05660464_2493 [Geodermatophilus dictyosporus]